MLAKSALESGVVQFDEDTWLTSGMIAAARRAMDASPVIGLPIPCEGHLQRTIYRLPPLVFRIYWSFLGHWPALAFPLLRLVGHYSVATACTGYRLAGRPKPFPARKPGFIAIMLNSGFGKIRPFKILHTSI